jgi:hypothetical protein
MSTPPSSFLVPTAARLWNAAHAVGGNQALTGTGMDAVEHLAKVGCTVPVLVWSMNSRCGPRMEQALSRARIWAGWHPFRETFAQAKTIALLLRDD